MKPTKNRVYCRDCGRQKILFETEKKANTFIKFNGEEIESESGYSPTRSYYCISCSGWHVTSSKEAANIKSQTEIVLERYREEKEKRSIEKARAAENRKEKLKVLETHFANIDRWIELLEEAKSKGTAINYKEILDQVYAEMDMVNSYAGSKKRKKTAEAKLAQLKSEFIEMKK